ncbi:MAG: potassium-transporting ATPase subunit KdpC [Candidatus Binataceae bacterium]
MRELAISIKMTIVLTLVAGLAYPLAMVGLARVLFPFQSAGSPIRRDGQVVGSALIGQNFTSPRYFHGRPSSAGDKGYDATASGGSNLAPTNRSLIDTVRKRLKETAQSEAVSSPAQVPVDLVTASASGLDPDISPAAAELQVARVAKLRHLSEDRVRELVSRNLSSRFLGIFGEPRVNVLMLNLALDETDGRHR